jgi:hypothetical protein
MKKLLVTVFALVLSAATALAADVTGKWSGEMKTPDGNAFPISYSLKQDGMKVTGTTEGPGGTIEIQDGKVDGEKVTFSINFEGGNGPMKITFTGTLTGEELTMSMGMEGGPAGGFPPFKLTRGK